MCDIFKGKGSFDSATCGRFAQDDNKTEGCSTRTCAFGASSFKRKNSRSLGRHCDLVMTKKFVMTNRKLEESGIPSGAKALR